jgi:hypothetical protein
MVSGPQFSTLSCVRPIQRGEVPFQDKFQFPLTNLALFRRTIQSEG